MAVHEVHWPRHPFSPEHNWPHHSLLHPRHTPPPSPSPILDNNRVSRPMTTVLPPIASFDTRNSYFAQNAMHYQHPPHLHTQYHHGHRLALDSESPPPRLPPIQTPPSFTAPPVAGPSRAISPESSPAPHDALAPPPVDWFSDDASWSSFALAEKTCEMICYLWFSKAAASTNVAKQTSPHLSYMPQRSANTAQLQFSVSSVFVNFMHKLLQTTQLSKSVIVLSLHYVYRLKTRNGTTVPSPGSEFRVAVAGLMMANKFVDDNTYTNKTWSEVSGIDLSEINKMEREFLGGLNFELYVDKQTYESWVNLLKGLVLSKERDMRFYRRSRQSRAVTVARPTPLAPLVRPRNRNLVLSPRARSSSPVHRHARPSVADMPVLSAVDTPVSFQPRLNGKRTALDAFSPTSASFDLERPPAKKPTGLQLDIPQSSATRVPLTPSPLDTIGFSKLSLGSSPAIPMTQFSKMSLVSSPAVASSHDPANMVGRTPQTLVTAYRVDPTKPRVAPTTLYFYSLAGSAGERKGRLHYHQPPPNPSTYQYSYVTQPAPVVVQSAHASPHDRVYHLPPVLPHPHDGSWTQPRNAYYDARPIYDTTTRDFSHPPPGAVQSAPFANAGPPGVQYYAHLGQSHVSPEEHWARGRQP